MGTIGSPIEEFLVSSRNVIQGLVQNESLAKLVAEYGYSQEKLAEGQSLWESVEAIVRDQKQGYGNQQEATSEFGTAWEAANTLYMKTLKVARVSFGADAKASVMLMLYGPRKQSFWGWVEQANTFYQNLVKDPLLLEKMKVFGYTKEKLEAEFSSVRKVADYDQKKKQGIGEAQISTQVRDKKLQELDKWVSDLRAICRVAFYEEPQQLEILGIKVRTTPKAKKKAATVS